MKVNFENINIQTLLKVAIGIGIVAILANIIISNYKSSYIELVDDWRRQRDNYFKNDPQSPIDEKESFSGLIYFEPNPEFKVDAHLTLLTDSTSFVMNRTDGQKDRYMRYAIATFVLEKKEYQLIVFKSIKNTSHDDMLFVPFTDRTTGELTYGTGRYLDIEQKEPDRIIVDFNYAYNPFCAYNKRYSCPIPPRENYIDLEILAGEKIFEKKKNSEAGTENN